jgi:hypothetical protein
MSWVLEPKNVTVIANKGLSLECKANGLPKPSIKWISAKGLNNILRN